mmetsp:Transcript_9274/g.11717  ORF Transcript_9274/g.11717 Transcript_9274/m.11717 type:complete len:681 (+) Transcript_9274:391-2433(+)
MSRSKHQYFKDDNNDDDQRLIQNQDYDRNNDNNNHKNRVQNRKLRNYHHSMGLHRSILFSALILLFVYYSEAFAASSSFPLTSTSSSILSSSHTKSGHGKLTRAFLHETRGGSLSSKSDNDVSYGNSNNGFSKIKKNGVQMNTNNNINIQPLSSPSSGSKDQALPCKYIAETNLPTDVGQFRLRAYRIDDLDMKNVIKNKYVGNEPCVIYCPDKPPFVENNREGGSAVGSKRLKFAKDVPVRIHDQCFTSEVFRSKRCDCKEQLKMSLEYIQKHGGAIIYLQQEGRGIGLANKVAAYALQDDGMDTVDANTHLGFPEDARQYGIVPAILSDMGIESVRLITNNPRKINRLKSLGVNVAGTIPMVTTPNKHNRKYLQTKKDRMNHRNFGDMLSLENNDSSELQDIVVEAVTSLYKNGGSVAEEFITDGEEMAAAAVSAALFESDSDSTSEEEEEDFESQAGVTASDDGYCFGRQSVEDAITAVKRGEIVVVVDDMDRENEGDFIMAADMATPETIATIVKYSSGVICIGMEGKRMDELKLPAMLAKNEDPKGTAFSVTVDASKEHGITTGISSTDRSTTIKLLANSSSTALDFARPGHIFPLRAKEGGVLTRDGHTEAAVDLSRLAGRDPSGVLCEIVSEENPVEMARLPELKRFCKKHGFVLTSIVDIAQYRRDTEDEMQ